MLTALTGLLRLLLAGLVLLAALLAALVRIALVLLLSALILICHWELAFCWLNQPELAIAPFCRHVFVFRSGE